MNHSDLVKIKIQDQIDRLTKNNDFILSTTITGSFNLKGIDSISDIDIVIIIDKLNKKKFEKIISDFKQIDTANIGLHGFKVIINSTFGPLKFDSDNSIVFHLMIYDVVGHIKHVEESPFTCHSWEQCKPLNGVALSDIYPVVTLNLSDLFKSRRGLTSYMNDLDSGTISYRKYEFVGSRCIEKKEIFKLDQKHKFEFSFHILFHLLSNFYKILTQDFGPIRVEKLKIFISNLGLKEKLNINLLIALDEWKKQKKEIDLDPILEIKSFLKNFFSAIEKEYTTSKGILFLRHQKTNLNNGTFLGIGRDPKIIPFENLNTQTFTVGYHSQLKRSIETIQKFNCKNYIECNLLNEINYGLVEGILFEDLKFKFPEIMKAWEKNLDPKFPKGENLKDVSLRVQKFINEVLDKNKKSLVVTHLVTLRLILLNLLNLSYNNLFKIQIKHLEGFEFIAFKEYLVPNFEKEFRTQLRNQLSKEYV